MLNILVAVILENFTSLGNLNADLVSISDIQAFHALWAEFDPDADQYIPAQDLPDLVRQLPAPMGLKGAPRRWAIRFCLLLGLTVQSDRNQTAIRVQSGCNQTRPDSNHTAPGTKHTAPHTRMRRLLCRSH